MIHLKEIGDKLMDIHSQHQNLLLNNEDFQLSVVDIIADNEELREEYTLLYNKYKEAEKQLEQIKKQIEATKENEEYLRYQFNELTNANLIAGELESLTDEGETISHAEDIKSALYFVDETFNGEATNLLGNLKQSSNSIANIEEVFPKVKDVSERMQSSFIELQDISRELSALLDEVDFDPMRMEFINERVNLLHTLIKKYKVESDAELIEKRDTLSAELSQIENSDEELKQAEKRVDECYATLMGKASELNETRRKAASKVEAEMQQRLVPLGIPNIRFEVRIESTEPTAVGADRVTFYFNANKNAQLQPVAQIASGGEIARVMLSLKAIISGATKLPTIIFDEIDTGVSGKIAEKMAEMMAEISNEGRQVISITHLPQIAAFANNHYKVFKEDNDLFSETKMVELTLDERIKEIVSFPKVS